MPFVLGPNALAAGYRLFSYDTIGSTSTEAMALARAGDRGRVWLASTEQTAGHGRRGRQWQTQRGNLAASVFVRTSASIARAATLGFVGGLALHDALSALAPDLAVSMALDHGETRGSNTRLALKWPNDLLASGKKVAGILLQAVDLGNGQVGVVAGIGVNVIAAPEGVPVPATSLHGLGNRITAEELFSELAEAWVGHERRWDDGKGLDAIRRLWLDRASGLGEEVAVRTDAGVTRGVFETIDEEGCLVVRAEDGSARRVTAGEVHFGAAASVRAAG
jgi:BirA family biotin operon repressor/biotin-[acetyl-CoA-carboxylase] ligase